MSCSELKLFIDIFILGHSVGTFKIVPLVFYGAYIDAHAFRIGRQILFLASLHYAAL